ncbi:MAG TPA: cysteine--tRNA ligase, partial [Burkholderiales bacterium]
EEWIEAKIAEREAARERKDYAAADRIRKELLDKDIVLEDKAGKTAWRRA